jgi:DNA-binding NarL/FixJ family response regulator
VSAHSTLLVAHPKELIRAGIRQLLDGTAVSIVGEAADATTALALARKLRPDVMLVDVGIPGGDCFELAYTVRQASPATKVVTISAIDNPTYMARAKAAGVVDHLAKGIGAKALVAAIVAAAAGKPGSGSRGFARIVSLLDATEKSCRAAPSLSPREDQILRHIALGLSNEEIARSLGIGNLFPVVRPKDRGLKAALKFLLVLFRCQGFAKVVKLRLCDKAGLRGPQHRTVLSHGAAPPRDGGGPPAGPAARSPPRRSPRPRR